MLREQYLLPFEMACKGGEAASIMSAYNQIGGTYATENRYTLQAPSLQNSGDNREPDHDGPPGNL